MADKLGSVVPWSYSTAKAFDTCPKQFYHERILRSIPREDTEATIYGSEFHTAAEEFIRDGTPLPAKFEFAYSVLKTLGNKPGKKLCEYKFGLTSELEPCEFDTQDVWFRGIVDLLVLQDTTAYIVDYKTSKSARYADKGQLELMALATFIHFPQVTKIRAGLVFVVSQDFVHSKYSRPDQRELWRKWLSKHAQMEKAEAADVWNPKPSGLCRKHCQVLECPHNGLS